MHCLASLVVICTSRARQVQVAHCEHSDDWTASNCRGELIGGVLTTLLLRALSQLADPPPADGCIPIYCDNLGVVCHGNAFLRTLPERQVQQDVLHLLK